MINLKSFNFNLKIDNIRCYMMSETTIGVSKRLKAELIKRKKHDKESYEAVIWRLIKNK